MARKQTVRVTIDADLLEWLRKEAQRRRVSMSFLIREFILQEMKARGELGELEE